jgi:ERO1-like protein beta
VSDTESSYSALDRLNARIGPLITDVTQETDFFAYYRLNLYNKACPFWSDSTGLCGNSACAVSTLENEEDIPKIWRSEELGKLSGPKAEHPSVVEQKKEKPLQGQLGDDVGESCVVEYDDECDERDYCVPEDEGIGGKGDYVSLVDNPERFTGYMGPSARQVWYSIYRENCFEPEAVVEVSDKQRNKASDMSHAYANRAKQQFRSVFQEFERQQQSFSDDDVDDDLDIEGECVEKRVFYRIISGMHASISTHLCWDHLNQSTGRWGPNLKCFEERLYRHPERVSNLYFNFALLLRAVGKLDNYLQDYTFCSGDPSQDRLTKEKVLSLSSKAAAQTAFDETVMFQDPAVAGLKDDFKNRFRNVSRIMDCVGCDKCRLWGKLQTAGYGAALKILFEFDDQTNTDDLPQLRRTELVALFNTLGRVSHSIAAIRKFKAMMNAIENGKQLNDSEQEQLIADIDSEAESFKTLESETIGELILEEIYNVLDAFTYIMNSWVELPTKM